MNGSSVGGRTKGRVEASGGVKALLLLTFDFLGARASSSSSMRLTERLMQGLCWVVQDPRAIAKDDNLNVILLNGLTNPLGMEFLEL